MCNLPHMPKVALLPTSEVARRLGVSVWTVHRWTDAGRIAPALKAPGLRGALLFDEAEVERVAAEIEAEAAS